MLSTKPDDGFGGYEAGVGGVRTVDRRREEPGFTVIVDGESMVRRGFGQAGTRLVERM